MNEDLSTNSTSLIPEGKNLNLNEKAQEMKKIKLKMTRTALVTTIFVIGLGIYDLVAVVSSGDTSTSVSQFLVNIGFKVPMVVFAVGFICGHVFGYMKPIGVIENEI